MDYRKIQVTGESTYTVSLPKEWIKKNGLDKGDVVYVLERGSELLMRLGEEKQKAAEIKIKTGDVEFISRLLITKYIQGYDTIVISSKDYIDSKVRRHLIKLSSFLIGLEPFGETKSSLTFKMLMKEGRNLEESVERMHDLSMLSLHQLFDVLESEDRNPDILNDIIQRDSEVDKFYFLILRQMSSLSGYEASIWVQIAKSMERLSDHIEKIAVQLRDGGSIREENLRHYKQLLDMYGDVMVTLKNRNLQMAEEILLHVDKFKSTDRKLMDKLTEREMRNILAYASFRRIADYISDVAESVINLS